MRIKNGYILKEIVGNYVAIPIGQNVIDYKNMLHLNETGAFIWKQLESDIDFSNLLSNMIVEYEACVEEHYIIQNDLIEFLNEIRELELLIE